MTHTLKALRPSPRAKANAAGMSTGTALAIVLAYLLNDVLGYQVPDYVTVASTVLMLKVSWFFSHKVFNNGGS